MASKLSPWLRPDLHSETVAVAVVPLRAGFIVFIAGYNFCRGAATIRRSGTPPPQRKNIGVRYPKAPQGVESAEVGRRHRIGDKTLGLPAALQLLQLNES